MTLAHPLDAVLETTHPRVATGAGALLLTDVDDTLLDNHTPRELVAESLAAVADRLEVVLVSSRTVDELLYLLHQLRIRADLIAENGACTAVRSPAVARALGARETVIRHGRRWYVASRGAPASVVLEAMRHARSLHAAEVRLATELPRRRRSELLGRDRHRARLASARRCSVLSEPPVANPAASAWLDALRCAGLRTAEGGRWLSVWSGPDKGEAALAYLAARAQTGLLPANVAAVGSSADAAPLLRAIGTRFLVRRPTGEYDPDLLALEGAVRLSASGHAGWRRAATLLADATAARLEVVE